MAVRLGGATSSCLCSPLGRPACTNKPNQGLWSNGNQTCPPPPLHFPPTLCRTKAPPTCAPAEGRTSIIPNRPENIPSSPSLFSHTAAVRDVPPLCISTDLLDPGAARLPPTHAYLCFLSLSHASSIAPLSPHLHLVAPMTPVVSERRVFFRVSYNALGSAARDEMSQTPPSRSLPGAHR